MSTGPSGGAPMRQRSLREKSFDALFELSVRALLVGFAASLGSQGGENP